VSLLDQIATNWRDVRTFGAQFLWRHSARATAAKTVEVWIPGFGAIHLRPGQSDVDVVRQIFGEREYDTEQLFEPNSRMLKRYSEILSLGKQPIIVDAGANIGATAIWFRTKYPKAKVVAIEPDEDNLAVLRLNGGRDDHIAIIAAGVGATNGFAAVQEGTLGYATKVVRSSSGVPIVSMNDAFELTEGGTPFIAKIDIEGFESDLFSTNLEWLESVFAVMIEPHDWMLPGKMTSRSFQCAMAEHNFEVFIRGENLIYVRA
jgi:FkbM family methyltransferase